MEEASEAQRAQVRKLAASLLTAQEEERRRVSRELHDQICQQLASLAIDIGGIVVAPPPSNELTGQLKALQARVVRVSEETRHIAYELHPTVLDDLGLVASLRSLCKDTSDKESIPVEFDSGPLPASLSRSLASCFYRVAQEGLQNIVKHSGATSATVALEAKSGTVKLSIEDDGVGFNAEEVRGHGGLGLTTMEERARLVNGILSISSRPGHGTQDCTRCSVTSGDK